MPRKPKADRDVQSELAVPEPSVSDAIVPDVVNVNNGQLPLYLQDWDKTLELLQAPFDPADVYFLPQTINYKSETAVAAAYADSRVYTARLNEVIGAGFWQSEIVRIDIAPFTKMIKEKTDWNTKAVITPASTISAHKVGAVVRVGIYMGPALGWVYQDSTGAKDTADENWITSAEAQAYKRAASKWGPGLYFYSFGKVSYPYNVKTGKWKETPAIPDWAYPVKFCSDCQNQIVTVQYKDKDNVVRSLHAWDVYQRSLTQYGSPLCVNCSKARRNAATPADVNIRLDTQAA